MGATPTWFVDRRKIADFLCNLAIGRIEMAQQDLGIFPKLGGLQSEHGSAIVADKIKGQRAVGFEDPLKDQAGGVGHHAFITGAGFFQGLFDLSAIGNILDRKQDRWCAVERLFDRAGIEHKTISRTRLDHPLREGMLGTTIAAIADL